MSSFGLFHLDAFRSSRSNSSLLNVLRRFFSTCLTFTPHVYLVYPAQYGLEYELNKTWILKEYGKMKPEHKQSKIQSDELICGSQSLMQYLTTTRTEKETWCAPSYALDFVIYLCRRTRLSRYIISWWPINIPKTLIALLSLSMFEYHVPLERGK